MKAIYPLYVSVVCGALLTVTPALAAPQARTYQVTGPVVKVTDTFITVKKGEDNLQVARDAGTKINGDLAVGARVTIRYRMVATDVEVKADSGGAGTAEKK